MNTLRAGFTMALVILASSPRIAGDVAALHLGKNGEIDGYETIPMPTPIADATEHVSLVGVEPMPPPAEPKAVIGSPLSLVVPALLTPSGMPVDVPAWEDPPIPAGALWPDSNGFITVPKKRAGEHTAMASPLRNPWDVRVTPKSKITEITLTFNGMIAGPVPVAFINDGHFSREDKVSIFNLAIIRRHEAVLEHDGSYFVIPSGREVRVRLPQN